MENAFTLVKVRFVGKRQQNRRVNIYVGNHCYTADGYVFGPGIERQTLRCEADVLTGATSPVVDDNGRVITGFVVSGDLGNAGLTGEGYEIVGEKPKPRALRRLEISPATVEEEASKE